MFYRQCFLISAAGIYGSLWTISTGSARHNWEKQVCCTDSWMCCSGLLCWKILEVDNVLKLVFTPCTGKICPITYCNYNLQSSIKLWKKLFLFHLYKTSLCSGHVLYLFLCLTFLSGGTRFSVDPQEDFGRGSSYLQSALNRKMTC